MYIDDDGLDVLTENLMREYNRTIGQENTIRGQDKRTPIGKCALGYRGSEV